MRNNSRTCVARKNGCTEAIKMFFLISSLFWNQTNSHLLYLSSWRTFDPSLAKLLDVWKLNDFSGLFLIAAHLNGISQRTSHGHFRVTRSRAVKSRYHLRTYSQKNPAQTSNDIIPFFSSPGGRLKALMWVAWNLFGIERNIVTWNPLYRWRIGHLRTG
jgi:hypothetical protein